MSFISCSSERRFLDAKFVSCFDVFVKSDSATIEQSFHFSELDGLRDDLMSIVDEIDSLIDHKKELDDFNNEQFGSSEGR